MAQDVGPKRQQNVLQGTSGVKEVPSSRVPRLGNAFADANSNDMVSMSWGLESIGLMIGECWVRSIHTRTSMSNAGLYALQHRSMAQNISWSAGMSTYHSYDVVIKVSS